MKHLLLAPFLLGFISPVSAEQPLFIQEILQRPIEDEKGWLKTKGSTSEWLEVKNWDNDEWWINSLASFYSKPTKKINERMIADAKIKACNSFIQLYDIPKELKDPCKSIYQQLPKRITRQFTEQQKAFYENREPTTDEISLLREKMGEDFKLFIWKRNLDYKFKKGWFNDQFITDTDNELSGTNNEKLSKRELLLARLGACDTYSSEKSFPTLGIYVNCLELVEKWKEINQTSNKKEEINTTQPSIKNSDNKKNHDKCLNAADYAGCMRYQNK